MYRALLLGAGICVILGLAWSAGLAYRFMPQPAICTRCIVPLSPREKADFAKWGALETAARTAKNKKEWAKAEADYQAQILLPDCMFRSECWVELGLMRDYQGKHETAFQAYCKGFGIGSHRGPCVGNKPETGEAASRCGLMCEDRGLHADACECYYTARRSINRETTLPMTLDAVRTSSATVRSLLAINLRDAQAEDKITKSPI